MSGRTATAGLVPGDLILIWADAKRGNYLISRCDHLIIFCERIASPEYKLDSVVSS